jgi:transcriptional regulator with XRE-family HTH domain
MDRFPIDNSIHRVVDYKLMNDVQAKIAILKEKGWTLANIGRALGQSPVTVEAWKAGTRSPANLQSVLASLEKLAKRKRIPPKKNYSKGSRKTNEAKL